MRDKNRNKNGVARAKAADGKARRLLALVVCIIVALALGLVGVFYFTSSSKQSAVQSADGGEVQRSATNYGSLTYKALVDKARAGTLAVGDYVTYSGNGTSGSSYYLNLPVGQYTVDVYGASGAPAGSYQGEPGKGAHIQVTLNVTDSIYLYITPGGQGSGKSGGYNGGGAGGTANLSDRHGCGGGGKSDVKRIINSSSFTDMIVAGGGGGGGGGSNGGTTTGTALTTSGGAGGNSGTDGTVGNSSFPGGGGKAGTSSAVGAGGAGGSGTNNGSNDGAYAPGAGGGGGGGYYGGGGGGGASVMDTSNQYVGNAGSSGNGSTGGAGGAPSVDVGASGGRYAGTGGGGGGGSSYIDTSFCTTVLNQNGAHTGHGLVQITVKSLGYTRDGAVGGTYSNITGDTFYNNILNGTYKNGNTVKYTYTNSVRSVNLAPGTYKLEAWGAQGGEQIHSNGGAGGYTYANYTVTSKTTLYLVTGGFPGTAHSGGYNGGGAPTTGASNGTYYAGGGGGATHIATANNVLSSLSGNTGAVLIVAGGGGGGQDGPGGRGGGGNNAGSAGMGRYGTRGEGGTTSGPGGGGTSGAFGQGGASSTGGDEYKGAAGGGGYYGGGGAQSDGSNHDDKGGGGGSGYIKSGLASGGGTSGINYGNGFIRITLVAVNQAPVNRGTKALTGGALGTYSATVYAYDLAQDNDYKNYNTGASANAVYYADTVLYLVNSSGTLSQNANQYISYSISGQTLSITAINKLPRQGVHSQAENKFTFYAKVRDNFSPAAQQKTIICTITLTMSQFNVPLTSVNATKGSYHVRAGKATSTSLNDLVNGTLAGSAVNKWVLDVQERIQLNNEISFNATELISGFTSYYAAYIVPSTVSSSSPFTVTGSGAVTLYTNAGGGSYNSTTGYSSVKLKATGASSSAQRTNWTVYVVEKSSIKGSYYEPGTVIANYTLGKAIELNFYVDNTRPTFKSGVNNVVTLNPSTTYSQLTLAAYFSDVDLPGSTITSTSHAITGVKVPDKEFVQSDKYGKIVSTSGVGGAAAGQSYYNVGSGSLANVAANATSDFDTKFNSSIAVLNTSSTANAFIQYYYNDTTLFVRGVRPSYSQYRTDRAGKAAYTGGTASSPSSSGTVANPGHFYLLIRISDKSLTSDTGIWLPIAFQVTGQNAPVSTGTVPPAGMSGQTAVTDMANVNGTVDQSFVFTPMGMNIGGKTNPIGYLDAACTNQKGLQALAIDGDNFATANGLSTWNNSFNEFLQINSTPAQIMNFINSSVGSKYITAELVDLYLPKTAFNGRVLGTAAAGVAGTKALNLTASGSNYVFKGLKITLKLPTMNRYFQAKVSVKDSNNSSKDVYFAFRCKDRAPSVYSNVTNVAGYKLAENSYSSYSYGNKTWDYTNSGWGAPTTLDTAVAIPTIKYRVPLHTRFIVTPYDLVSDVDIDTRYGSASMRPAGGFTLNGLGGTFENGTFTVGTPSVDVTKAVNPVMGASYAGDYKTTINTMLGYLDDTTAISRVSNGHAHSTAVSSANVVNDRLFIMRSSDSQADAYTYNPYSSSAIPTFDIRQTNTTGYVNVDAGRKVAGIGSAPYDLDFLSFFATKRTVQPATVDITVRDRYGNSDGVNGTVTVRVEIEVVNTAPTRNPGNAIEMSVGGITEGGIVKRTDDEFLVASVISDLDDDTCSFITERGLLIANTRDIVNIANLTSFTDSRIPTNYLTDDEGNNLGDFYVSANILSNKIEVHAIGSTKNVSGGVYIYFFATDNQGGEVLGYKQVEVVNTLPDFNVSVENGFSAADNYTWSIKSTNNSDKTRSRYIVSSTNAANAIKSSTQTDLIPVGAVDADIKIIASDKDKLQSIVLAPAYEDGGTVRYVTLSGTDYEHAVPTIVLNSPQFTQKKSGDVTLPAAVLLYMADVNTGVALADESVPAGYDAQLLFYVDGAWKSRDQVVSLLQSADAVTKAKYFDNDGRFIVTDWALKLRASGAYSDKLAISLSYSDNAEFGGDTAGKATAYNTVRPARVVVAGRVTSTVYQTISDTGIRVSSEFTAYDNYYVVNDPQYSRAYISTYDGDTTSTFGSGMTELKYDSTTTTLNDSGDKIIKTRAAGTADMTLAGTNSGAMFSRPTTSNEADFVGAFKYQSVISVPSSKTGSLYDTVYVPMSFFGTLQDIASSLADGTVKYPDPTKTTEGFVGYNIVNGDGYDKGNIDKIAPAITLSDGETVWGGESGKPLADNPYIVIGAFDQYDINGNGSAKSNLDTDLSRAYYNNRLAVSTVDADGRLNAFVNKDENKNNFVGDGRIMYLAEQATKTVEHNFGLTFRKNAVRTGAHNLTLTVSLARSLMTGDGSVDKRNVGTTEESIAMNTAVATVQINVENGKFDLSLAKEKGNVLNYSDKAGEETYYIDVPLKASSSKTFALINKDGDENDTAFIEGQTGVGNILYTDPDYKKVDSAYYNDRAYFSMDSLDKMSTWRVSSTRVRTVTDEAEPQLVNTIDSDKARKSIYNYFGVNSASEVADSTEVPETYQANGGIYGTNFGVAGSGNEGYSDYFKATVTDGGRSIDISAYRKTTINTATLQKLAEAKGLSWNSSYADGGLAESDIKKFYADRGLVASVTDDVISAYYPLRVIIYDDFGAGWDDASFVAMEFRISVDNARPSIKTDVLTENTKEHRYEIEIPVAVGHSQSLNLFSFVSDPDFAYEGSGDFKQISTKTDFETKDGIIAETSDYLEPLYSYAPINTTQAQLLADEGGLSPKDSTDNDVIMWMETNLGDSTTTISRNTLPKTNTLGFTVHRRTTDASGLSRNAFEFTLRFRDSSGLETADSITFIVTVANQAPSSNTRITSVTMRSGDSFTLLTSSYSDFVGGVVLGNSASGNDDGSKDGTKAYTTSATHQWWYSNSRTNKSEEPQSEPPIWQYNKVDTTSFVPDSTGLSDQYVHLGYIPVATDDTPWRMRFYSDRLATQYWQVYPRNVIPTEGSDGAIRATALLIVASKATTTKQTLTVEIIDGEGGTYTHKIDITIVSAKPEPLDPEHNGSALALSGLEGVEDGDSGYLNGTYRTFIIPSVPNGQKSAPVTIDGLEGGTRTARKTTTVTLTNIARDPDGNSDEMTLFNYGQFTVNGTPMVNKGGIYTSEFFDITINPGSKSFTITAKAYNPNSPFELLEFYIADPGNPISDNAVKFAIQVYTVYSNMRNDTIAAMTTVKQYNDYLAGSNVVKVKSHDEFVGEGAFEGIPMPIENRSVYPFIKLAGNTDFNGVNTNSPIVDPDVSEVGVQRYTARFYALMSGGNPLDPNALKELFDYDASTGKLMFKLHRDNDHPTVPSESYLIGGIERTADGAPQEISIGIQQELLSFVRQYVDFEFELNGSSVSFAPKTSNLNTKILLYIEVEKPLGSRENKRTDGVEFAGTLFSLEIEDSAPVYNDTSERGHSDEYNVDYSRVFTGAVGDEITFNVFDSNDEFGLPLFKDSDMDDNVTVTGFDSANLNVVNQTYARAMAKALAVDPTLDWRGVQGGKEQAFTITYNSEANTLTIRINRRMDKLIGEGASARYADAVSFPIVITGQDEGKGGVHLTGESVILLTVLNTDATAVDSFAHYATNNVGYSFHLDEYNDTADYTIDAQILRGDAGSLTINVSDFMRDADVTTAAKDTDSFMFVEGEDRSPAKYVIDQPVTVVYNQGDDVIYDPIDFAKITPIGTDKYHRTALKIEALNAARGCTGTAYLRVVDRSCDYDIIENGVLVQINITIMNEAPYVIDPLTTPSASFVGSTTDLPEPQTFFIGDYIDDNNISDVTGPESEKHPNTYLRIFSTEYKSVTEIYSTSEEPLTGSSEISSSLFTVIIPGGKFNQYFTIQPKTGIFGKGTVEIVVADGDINTQVDTLTTRFRFNVEVIYNPSELPELKSVNTNRGKTTFVTIDTIIPDIDSTIEDDGEIKVDSDMTVPARNAAASFNPASSYVLLEVTPAPGSEDYVEITHEDGSASWSLKAKKVTGNTPRRINVKYALQNSPEDVVENYFMFVVAENEKPTLIYNEITFIKYADTTESDSFMLDTTNTVKLRADQLFVDPERDVMRFGTASSQKPSLVSVSVENNSELLAVTFNARGSSQITVTVIDETDEAVSRTFTVINNDLPEPSLWMRITASFESNKIIWAIIIGAVLLLIVVLIIIIAVVRKKKREREELEALLVSEMEIEEQMYRLAGGPSPMGYQSYGYLQSAPGQTVDPGMLLGAGGAPVTPPELALPAPDSANPNAQTQQQAPLDGFDGMNRNIDPSIDPDLGGNLE